MAFEPAVDGEGRLLVWGGIRLRVMEGRELTLVWDSDLGDVLLRCLCSEL